MQLNKQIVGIAGLLLTILLIWVFVANMIGFSRNISKERNCGPDEMNYVTKGDCKDGWYRNYAKIIKCEDSEEPIEAGCIKEGYVCCTKNNQDV